MAIFRSLASAGQAGITTATSDTTNRAAKQRRFMQVSPCATASFERRRVHLEAGQDLLDGALLVQRPEGGVELVYERLVRELLGEADVVLQALLAAGVTHVRDPARVDEVVS